MELNFYSAFIELCFLRGLAGFGKGFVFLCQNMARDVSMAANQQNKMLKTNSVEGAQHCRAFQKNYFYYLAIEWGSEYQTSLVFKCSKGGVTPNGPLLECLLCISTSFRVLRAPCLGVRLHVFILLGKD